MIIFAANYVGEKLIEFISMQNDQIDVLIYKPDDKHSDKIISYAKHQNNNLMIYTDEQIKLNDVKYKIKKMNLEYGFLLWWPKILSKDEVDLTRRGFINTHPSLLPYNRGKHPYVWCLLDQTPFGVSLHWINEKIDKGFLICQKEIKYDWHDTGESLYKKAIKEIILLFKSNYSILANRSNELTIITDGTHHYGREIKKIEKLDLEKSYPLKYLLNIIRSRMFNGKGETYFEHNGSRYYISVIIKKDNYYK